MINTPQGKNVDDFRSSDDSAARSTESRRILLPYLILIACQLPLCLLYFKGLWVERVHYSLFPVSLIGVGYFLYARWPRADEPAFFPSNRSDIFLFTGIAMGVMATLLLSPWFAFASMLCLLASLLVRTNDRHIFGSLLPAIAPLIVLLQPPLAIDFDTVQGDIQLMSRMNSWSTNIASDILDLMQYPHNVADSRMEFVGQAIDSTALGNNTLSLFTLLIVTGLFIAWQRRPMFRATLLLIAACFWSMAFEALELAVCGVMQFTFEQDYFSPGISNRIVQVSGLFGAGIMTLLSDRLISFLFGPVDISAIDDDISYQDIVCRFWNRSIAGISSPVIDVNIKQEVAWARRRGSSPSAATASMLWAAAILLASLSAFQAIGVVSAFSKSGGSAFAKASTIHVDRSAIPAQLAGLTLVDHVVNEPTVKSPFDAVDSHFTFTDAEENRYHLVIRQPFSGWHDILRETKSYDWDLIEKSSQQLTSDSEIPAIHASYSSSIAEFRDLYSCQIDGFARGFEAPTTWSNFGEFLGRLRHRITNRTHPRVISFKSIEINVYCDTVGEAPEAVKASNQQLFNEASAHVLDSIRNESFGSAEAAEVDPDPAR